MKITVNGRSTASSAPAPTKKAQPSADPRTAKRAPRVSRQEAIKDVRRRVAPTVEEPDVNYEEPKAPAPVEDKIEEPTAQPKEKLEMKRRSRSKPVAGSDDSVLAVQHHRDREDVKRRRPAPKKIEADPLMDDDDNDDDGFDEIDRAEPLFSKPVVREKPSAEKHATKREKLTRPLKRMMNEKPTAKLTHASKPMGHMNPIAEEEVEEEPEELLETSTKRPERTSIEESEEVPEMTKKRPRPSKRMAEEEPEEAPETPKKRSRRMAEEEPEEAPKMPKKRPRPSKRMAEEESEEAPEMPKKRPRPSKRMAEEETDEAPQLPKKRSRKEVPEKPAKKSKPSKKPSKKARSAGEPVDLPNAKFNPIPLCISLLITAIGAAGGYYGVQLLLKSVATIS